MYHVAYWFVIYHHSSIEADDTHCVHVVWDDGSHVFLLTYYYRTQYRALLCSCPQIVISVSVVQEVFECTDSTCLCNYDSGHMLCNAPIPLMFPRLLVLSLDYRRLVEFD